ncbi:MAG: porin family protein, partial [bacterium]|nr:porin family protein [bacterium]
MRHLGTALLLCLTVLWASEAKGRRAVHLYVSGGLNEPVDRLGSRVETGFGGSLAVSYAPASLTSDGAIEFTLRGRYDVFKAVSNTDRNFDFASVSLGIKFNVDPTERTNYYLLMEGGPTFTRWKSSTSGNQEIPRKTTTNYHLSPGFGIEFVRPHITPFAEFRLVNVAGELIGDYFFF